jgi:hypothetical protein
MQPECPPVCSFDNSFPVTSKQVLRQFPNFPVATADFSDNHRFQLIKINPHALKTTKLSFQMHLTNNQKIEIPRQLPQPPIFRDGEHREAPRPVTPTHPSAATFPSLLLYHSCTVTRVQKCQLKSACVFPRARQVALCPISSPTTVTNKLTKQLNQTTKSILPQVTNKFLPF